MRGPLSYIISFISGGTDISSVIFSVFGVLAFLFICIPIHECSHALAAKALGDDTASRQGRLTLNPFAHIDPVGSIVMFICGIGWAKPTPVNISRCRKVKPRVANVIVSAAGPLSNIIMGYIFVVIYKVLVLVSVSNGNALLLQAAMIVYYVAMLNCFIAVFNLIPIPPFDGWHILSAFLPTRAIMFMERNAQIINWVMIILLVTGAVSTPISYVSGWIMDFFDFATGFVY